MPSVERDAPADWQVRHHHSASSGALIPMWDSSDPERAPPPLPLNPQSPSVGTSRAGTSAAIQSAHAALQEKARENALVPTLAKRMTDTSPERALVHRGSPSPHKRMQSMQNPSVRDLSMMLEGSARRDTSPEKISRPTTPSRGRENERDREKSMDRDVFVGTPTGTPTSAMPTSFTPVVRPAVRRPPYSILGENTPPQSATMLALQSMHPNSSREATPVSTPIAEPPLANITNNSNPIARPPPSMDGISHQIFALTNIATSLQKEMSLLTRRSKDNATDLMSLKEATHARDEDIRKSLRELASTSRSEGNKHALDRYNGGLYLDDKPHMPGSPGAKMRQFALPRIPSPTSFAASIDRESLATPSLVGGDTPATMALLEKIIREMGTKDGQDMVIGRLSELAERLSGLASAGKMQEMINQLKITTDELTCLSSTGGQGGNGGGGGSNRPRNYSFDDDDDDSAHDDENWSQPGGGQLTYRANLVYPGKRSRRSSAPSGGSDVLTDDMMKIIRSVKDSVTQSGGLTAEVKALVRELRGEVLGMGREIGRRLDEQSKSRSSSSEKNEPPFKHQMEAIIEEGLTHMRNHMNQLLREHRRSSELSNKSIDYQEIYNSVRSAMKDVNVNNDPESELTKDDILETIRDAWEDYKPDVHVEHIGLERDEVLACLKQGIEEFAPRNDTVTREEVSEAVVDAMKNFTPPQVDTPANLSRDEILEAVRECLEEFEFPVAPSALNNELTREDMHEAVKKGLESFEMPQSQALVKRDEPGDSAILDRLYEIMQFMKDEFKTTSEETKQNVAVHGQETEQVLEVTKDGFEQLRAHIEVVVGRDSGSTGQHEAMETIVQSLDSFRDELVDIVGKASEGSKTMLKEEVESLRDAVNSSLVPHQPPHMDNREVFDALREGLERVRQELLRPHAGTTDILDALSEGFDDLRTSIGRMSEKPADLTANDEILDALKCGLDGVKTDIASLREGEVNNETALAPLGMGRSNSGHNDLLEALNAGLEGVRGDIQSLRATEGGQAAIEAGTAPNSEILETMQASLDKLGEDIASLREQHDEASKAIAPIETPGLGSGEAVGSLRVNLTSIHEELTLLREHHDNTKAIAPADAATGATEEMLDSLKADFNAFREELTSLHEQRAGDETAASAAGMKDEILESITAGIEGLRGEMTSGQSAAINEESLDSIKIGLDSIREELNALRGQGDNSMALARIETASVMDPELLDAIKAGLDNVRGEIGSLREEIASKEAVPSEEKAGIDSEVFDGIKAGIEHIREEMSSISQASGLPAESSAIDPELLSDIKSGLDNIREEMSSMGQGASAESAPAFDPELLEGIKMGIESIKVEISTIGQGAAPSAEPTPALDPELFDGIKASLDSIKEEMATLSQSVAVPAEPAPAVDSELLNGIKSGLDDLRGEITCLREQGDGSKAVALINDSPGPNEELLSAIKSGLDNVQVDILALRDEQQNGKQDTPDHSAANGEILDTLKAGLESVREDISSLRDSSNDKALAVIDDTNSAALVPVNMAKHDDIKNLEMMIAQLCVKVETIEPTPAPEALTKEDLSEMEQMLRAVQESVSGMGAKEGEPKEPSLEEPASKDDVLAIENILRNTKGRLDDLIDGEQAVRKEHVDAVETLILDTKENLNALSAHLDLVSKKDDILAVESLVTQIVVAFDEMKERAEKSLEDPERVTKTDVDAVEAACMDIKSTIDQVLKTDLEALSSKEDLARVEGMLQETKAAVDGQVETVAKGFEERQAEIVGVGERVTEVRAFLEEFQTVIKERLEHDESGLGALNKLLASLGETVGQTAAASDLKDMFEAMKADFEETRNSYAGGKLDGDEKLQAAADGLNIKFDERIGELLTKYDAFEAVMAERATAGEARDTNLETAVVGTKAIADELKILIDTLGSTVTESMEKMEEASKTVYDRVDEFFTKSEENHTEAKNEHALTRDEIKVALTAVEGLQGQVVEYQPQVLESIKNVLLAVGEHFEHSKTTSNELQQTIEVVKNKEIEFPPPPEKYDDANVHTKLDKLVDHTGVSDQAYARFDALDKVHAQVVQTAADIQNFLEAQTKREETEQENREKALQETNTALAVATTEKEHVEANVASLKSEEEQLRESIEALKAEQESLTRQKARLTADVSSLETAMHIRKEELQAMETRAEGLERRILDGVLDHSRAMLITKSAPKGRDVMSRKRNPGARSSLSNMDAASLNSSKTSTPHRKGVSIAVNNNRANLAPPGQAGGRRILSLNQINNSAPTGGIKRSQSVRNTAAANGNRKRSWGGNLGNQSLDENGDKENDSLGSIDEPSHETDAYALEAPDTEIAEDGENGVEDSGDEASNADTLRRSSAGVGEGEIESYDGQSE